MLFLLVPVEISNGSQNGTNFTISNRLIIPTHPFCLNLIKDDSKYKFLTLLQKKVTGQNRLPYTRQRETNGKVAIGRRNVGCLISKGNL